MVRCSLDSEAVRCGGEGGAARAMVKGMNRVSHAVGMEGRAAQHDGNDDEERGLQFVAVAYSWSLGATVAEAVMAGLRHGVVAMTG